MSHSALHIALGVLVAAAVALRPARSGVEPAVPRSAPTARAAAVAVAVARSREPEPLVSVPRTGPDAAPAFCASRRHGELVKRHTAVCPRGITAAVERWAPDVLVALGGGMLRGSNAGCATAQRAFATYTLFEALGRRPTLLLSGRGGVPRARRLDAAERACAASRLAQETQRARTDARRARASARASRFVATQSLGPTEADLMCAEIVRRYPEGERAGVLARMVFEGRSGTTAQNVRFSTPLLAGGGFARALVVSTPVVRRRGRLDNHPARALVSFQRARHGTRYELAAVGCPYENGGPAWAEFEAPAASLRVAALASRELQRGGR